MLKGIKEKQNECFVAEFVNVLFGVYGGINYSL